MPVKKYLYRILRDDEHSELGLSARNPEAKDAKVSSHVNGLKKSPYISFTASKTAAKAYKWLAMKHWQKKNNYNRLMMFDFDMVKVDLDKLLEENSVVEVFDLSKESVREQYLAGNKKLRNYAAKYEEVLIKGYIPANCIADVPDSEALTDYESSSMGYDESDYTTDEGE